MLGTIGERMYAHKQHCSAACVLARVRRPRERASGASLRVLLSRSSTRGADLLGSARSSRGRRASMLRHGGSSQLRGGAASQVANQPCASCPPRVSCLWVWSTSSSCVDQVPLLLAWMFTHGMRAWCRLNCPWYLRWHWGVVSAVEVSGEGCLLDSTAPLHSSCQALGWALMPLDWLS